MKNFTEQSYPEEFKSISKSFFTISPKEKNFLLKTKPPFTPCSKIQKSKWTISTRILRIIL